WRRCVHPMVLRRVIAGFPVERETGNRFDMIISRNDNKPGLGSCTWPKPGPIGHLAYCPESASEAPGAPHAAITAAKALS
ncbi:MAG: hypothetical protein ABSG91_23365, partial [Syntrophobacteraceae bacterium]